jgi:hypothetical protein
VTNFDVENSVLLYRMEDKNFAPFGGAKQKSRW